MQDEADAARRGDQPTDHEIVAEIQGEKEKPDEEDDEDDEEETQIVSCTEAKRAVAILAKFATQRGFDEMNLHSIDKIKAAVRKLSLQSMIQTDLKSYLSL